jgi:hypothetical protein
MGDDYTLLRFDPAAEVSGLLRAAEAVGVPLTVVDIDADEIPAAYRHRLVLSRPDQHVAWRGGDVPADPVALIDLVRGAMAV